MGKALYRKYRSKSLDEIIGQPHITTTLANAVKSGQISHAYLFTGPRGVGKTSIARILAHEINQLTYDEDSTHLDIIEIDAASNRRIDEIREIRDRVHIAPTSSKYKVYIIDEVHMLTKEAFNALLKTLEEPPAHVVFILATTEAHKLPETIVSRTQRHNFKPVTKDEVVDHLASIAKQEGFDVDSDALELIAEHGEGSFRDSISLLDQLGEKGASVSLEHVQNVLGIAPNEIIKNILTETATGQAPNLVKTLVEARSNGYNANLLAKQLSDVLRNQLIAGKSLFATATTSHLLAKLLAVPSSHDQFAALELALLEVALTNSTLTTDVITAPVLEDIKPASAPNLEPAKPEPRASQAKPEEKPEKIKKAAPVQPTKTQQPAVSEASNNLSSDEPVWPTVLETIKKSHNTLYSVARMASAEETTGAITLTFAFAFHQKRLNENKNKQVLMDVASKLAGRPIIIDCLLGKAAPKAAATTPLVSTSTKHADTISTISNIFGSAEVLES